jgi:hypothetical protein
MLLQSFDVTHNPYFNTITGKTDLKTCINKMNSKIRAVSQTDLNELKNVVDLSGLFPPEYLDDMISGYFNNPDIEEIWFTYIDNEIPKAIGYCVPEKLTDGTYNLLAIGVTKAEQGKGIAKEMMNLNKKMAEF